MSGVTPDNIKVWIEEGLSGAQADVDGDGRHFEATIIWEGFAGKSKIQQHQAVYAALGERMKSDIHALSMRTYVSADEVS